MRFDWDPRKATSNARKHGVRFDEAVTVFADPLALYVRDELYGERTIPIGLSERRRMLFVVFSEMVEDAVRIISARRATPHERRRYEEEDA